MSKKVENFMKAPASKHKQFKNGKKRVVKSKKTVSLGDFKIINKLGDGAQACVYLVEKLNGVDSGSIYALKTFNKKDIFSTEISVECLQTERSILQKIKDYPFLVKMMYAFENVSSFYLVLEFAQGGEMFNVIKNFRSGLNILQARFYIAEVILALEQLHKLNILYRDLKLENILLDAEGHIMLADFGLSVDLVKGVSKESASFAGTLEYLSPESIREDTHLDLMSDWWSVGILSYELFTGQCPFSSHDIEKEEFFAKVLNDDPVIDDKIKGSAREFVLGLLQKDASERLGAKSGAEEIKKHPFFYGIDWNLMYHKKYPTPFANKYVDKYDVTQFDTEFTSSSIDSTKRSEPLKQKKFKDFGFISPNLTKNIKNTATAPAIKMTKILKENLKLIFNEHAKLMKIGNLSFLYVDNKNRPSLIIEHFAYKKNDKKEDNNDVKDENNVNIKEE